MDHHENGEGRPRAGPLRVGQTSAERIVALARRFPTIAQADGLDPFDAEKLDAWACGPVPGSGAFHSATFILNLWNCRAEWKCGRFDLHHAMACWDADHIKAVSAWIADPWWP